MKRIKIPKLVISFGSTTSAMAAESLFQSFADSANLGRLIPKPAQFGAGCGLAWCSDIANEKKLLALMSENGIAWKEIKIVDIREVSHVEDNSI
ncbi:MAG: DUF3343 domain-containing protein [Defluviitaleaceae bacterium]|nr:DUF3343 domain-containing protein [Defluviitaleaceae bacterium]